MDELSTLLGFIDRCLGTEMLQRVYPVAETITVEIETPSVGDRKTKIFFRRSPFILSLAKKFPESPMRKIPLALAIILLLPSFCWSWGREGHRVIATVAEDHLNETTRVMIQSLIGNNHLYSVASWADDIRKQRRETAPWHYVNIPLGSTYSASRDCPPPRSCVVEKIGDFVKVLMDKKASREQRAEALKWVVHLVGDIHQPLHAAKEAEGGNGIHVRFLGDDRCGHYDCNLHGVWDTSMILRAGLKPNEYADRLEQLVKADHLAGQDDGTPEQWASESVRLAQAAWCRTEQAWMKVITSERSRSWTGRWLWLGYGWPNF